MSIRIEIPVIQPPRLLAPRGNGDVLSSPPLANGVELALRDARRFAESEVQIGDRSLPEFREWTKSVCTEAARSWMATNLDVIVPQFSSGLLFVTGHQPQLNHAGVWMKNVAVSRLAECCGGRGLNLVVDNDLAGPPVLRLPAGTRQQPKFQEIPFDAPHPTKPWEELEILDRDEFRSFADRIEQSMKSWGIEPNLQKWWPAAVDAMTRSNRLDVALTACRVAHERNWGIQNLELPVSEMCRTAPFLAFLAHLCRHFERFFASYNSSVAAYRKKYRVRNDRHPVPSLEQIGNRYELPFWFWKPGASDRLRVFIERTDQLLTLTAGDETLAVLPAEGNSYEELLEIESIGRFRTRALTTTLFSRVCLSDLFLHGIGGARYDEITDGIIREFLGIEAPSFIVLTATLHLPLDPFPAREESVSELRNSIRHLQFDGPMESESERVLELREQRDRLMADASECRAQGACKSERRIRRAYNRKRHQELVEIRKELADIAAPAIEGQEERLEQLQKEVQANAILKSREYATCLFPEEQVKQLVGNLRIQICGKSRPEASM
ncbi:hypothetical protein SH668x_001867 [Planctomicrobium sp. SH668]|uniref:hypothetical protein n=1 Tax=Planctomicrobium sp. SH668 TaxID=3448126 RepID=UPI003F5C5180